MKRSSYLTQKRALWFNVVPFSIQSRNENHRTRLRYFTSVFCVLLCSRSRRYWYLRERGRNLKCMYRFKASFDRLQLHRSNKFFIEEQIWDIIFHNASKTDANTRDRYYVTMRNKTGESAISTGNIKLEKAMFYTQAFVLLYLFVSTSAETQLGCSVTRGRFGDRFVFFNYSGTCNKGINPCKLMNGEWRKSVRNCSCQCKRSNSTYREDLRSCVKNNESREGRYRI